MTPVVRDAAEQQRRKRVRLKGFDYRDTSRAYFITLCAMRGSRPFEDEALARQIIEVLEHLRADEMQRLFCYCLMPDHLHLVLSPMGEGRSFSDVLRDFKTYTNRKAWELGWPGRLWQRSYYDHIGRRREDLVKMCKYILANPVRAGLAEDPEGWPYSGEPDPLPW